jgi:four helix bundle protein
VAVFRDLEVYRRSTALADRLRSAVLRWSPLDQWTVGVQLIRAVDSVGANLAEGSGRVTDNDRRRFLVLARGSALEAQHWIQRAVERRLALDDAALDDAVQIGRMLNGLLRATARTTND